MGKCYGEMQQNVRNRCDPFKHSTCRRDMSWHSKSKA